MVVCAKFSATRFGTNFIAEKKKEQAENTKKPREIIFRKMAARQ